MHRSNIKTIFARCLETLREAGQEPTEVPSSVGDKVFPIIYQYPGIHVASFCSSYWSILKVLNIALMGLEAKLSAIESAYSMSEEQRTPAQTLVALNMVVSRENLTYIVVAECTRPQDMESAALASNDSAMGSGEASKVLPDRTSFSPVSGLAPGTRSSKSPAPTVNSLTDYPTMSTSDTTKRRQMYMAENTYCAHQICKSVESVSTAAFLGPIFLIFSMRACSRMLDDPIEKEWVLRKMEALGQTWGLAKTGPTEGDVSLGLSRSAIRGSSKAMGDTRPRGEAQE